jgi:hypothetical protein
MDFVIENLEIIQTSDTIDVEQAEPIVVPPEPIIQDEDPIIRRFKGPTGGPSPYGVHGNTGPSGTSSRRFEPSGQSGCVGEDGPSATDA